MSQSDNTLTTAAGPLNSRRSLRTVLTGGLLLTAIIGSGIAWLQGNQVITTDNAYVKASMLLVSPAIEGVVTRIAVTEGQEVKPGDLLFTLDNEPFHIAVNGAQAQVDAAKVSVRQSQANYRKALLDIQISAAQVELDRQNFNRVSSLLRTASVSRADFDAKKTAVEKSAGELAVLRQAAMTILASLGGNADGSVDEQPGVLLAQAQLEKARRDLRLSEVRATLAGRVARVDAIQPGMRMAAGQAAFFLVSGSDVWIDASPKETDLGGLYIGAPAAITVDSYPGKRWRGQITVIGPASASSYSILPAQNASGNWVKVVQRISVRIAIDNEPDQPLLRHGMSAEVAIDTGRAGTLNTLWHRGFKGNAHQ